MYVCIVCARACVACVAAAQCFTGGGWALRRLPLDSEDRDISVKSAGSSLSLSVFPLNTPPPYDITHHHTTSTASVVLATSRVSPQSLRQDSRSAYHQNVIIPSNVAVCGVLCVRRRVSPTRGHIRM